MDARIEHPDAEAVHAVTKVHIFDSIITELDGHLAGFAPSESELDISELGKDNMPTCEGGKPSCLDSETPSSCDFFSAAFVHQRSKCASQGDDFETVFTALDGSTTSSTHLKWSRRSVFAVFTVHGAPSRLFTTETVVDDDDV